MYKVLFINLNQHTKEETPHTLNWNELGFSLEDQADNCTTAISLLKKRQYSLLIINMYDLHADGLDLCGRIRSLSTVPIVLIGDSTDFQLARRAMYYQVSDYLPSPLSIDEITTSLQNVKHKLDCTASAYAAEQLLILTEEDSSRQELVINKVKEYVEETLHQNITLKHISNIMHFNCSYLGQKFKIHENMTFNEYLLQQRMEKAKNLLEHTDLKVYEIANGVGYTEIDWFYKKFKSYTGVSANEYRKKSSHSIKPSINRLRHPLLLTSGG